MDGKIDTVREALKYVSVTGKFYWKIHTGPSVVGKEAGYVNKRGAPISNFLYIEEARS